jgi:Flp pilus assembly protein CpaB
MNNKNKIILGVAISYFVVISLVAFKLSRAGGEDKEEDIEDIELEEEKKVE